MEKDADLWYSENKAEQLVKFSAPSKEIRSKKGKGKKKKNNNNNKKDKIKEIENKVEEVEEPVPE